MYFPGALRTPENRDATVSGERASLAVRAGLHRGEPLPELPPTSQSASTRSREGDAMSFAAEYLAQLEAFAARSALPRVRALHPPERPADDGRHGHSGHARGEFCALELDDGSIGLSYVLLDDTLARLRDSSGLAGVDALALARATSRVRASTARSASSVPTRSRAACSTAPASVHRATTTRLAR